MSTHHLKIPSLHTAQTRVRQESVRFNVVDCGRRWGKTVLGIDRAIDVAIHGYPVGWFSASYKILADAWRDTRRLLLPVTLATSAQEHRLELVGGGCVEFWSLEGANPGRGRKYKRIIGDEVGRVADFMAQWTEDIRPTLADYQGDAWFCSTPRGRNAFHTLYNYGQDPEQLDWRSWQMPTSANPFIADREVESARRELPDRVFRQEYLAEFLEDAGGVFIGVSDCVDSGRSANEPRRIDRQYGLGVDLARTEDFTVLCVVDNTGRQVYFERFNQVAWERQIERILAVATVYSPVVAVIDSTGVGDPVLERIKMLAAQRQIQIRFEPAEGFTFTNTSKQQVVNALALAIEHREVSLLDVPVQTAELQAYAYDVSPGGSLRMNAPEGMHDDTVIALALAHWARQMMAYRIMPRLVSLDDIDDDSARVGAVSWTGDEGWETT
jgi:hypothetical protein